LVATARLLSSRTCGQRPSPTHNLRIAPRERTSSADIVSRAGLPTAR
jgi:hypothetical protein